MPKYKIGAKFVWREGYKRNSKPRIIAYDSATQIYSMEFTNNTTGTIQVNTTSWMDGHIDQQMISPHSELEIYVLNKLKAHGYA